MNQYYGVTRSDAYLAHYGVKGMKWGVRKALYNNDARALRRQYQKAAKKLAKLEKRGNSGAKYAARAGLLGAGAAAVGGMAFSNNAIGKVGNYLAPGVKKIASTVATKRRGIINSSLTGNAARKSLSEDLARRAIVELDTKKHRNSRASGIISGSAKGKKSLQYYTTQTALIQKPKHFRDGDTEFLKLNGRVNPKPAPTTNDVLKSKKVNLDAGKSELKSINDITNKDIGRAALGLTAAGLAGAAGYNAYRAATTKRARRKAVEFRKAMNETFAGTEYEKLGGLPIPKQKRRKHR